MDIFGHIVEVDVECRKNLHNLHNDSSFLPEITKIKKVRKLVANLNDKAEYVINIINLKQTLNYALVQKHVDTVIKFNERDWLKEYIDTNRELRKKRKKEL